MEKQLFKTDLKLLNEKIEKFKKIKKIINLLDTKYKKSYIHFSSNKLKLDNIYNTNKNMTSSYLGSNVYFNPKGLWISCSSSWLKYELSSTRPYYVSSILDAKYIYKVDLDKLNILEINKLEQLIDFHLKYLKKNNKLQIDWKEVKKKYDGIIICPYLGYKIWEKKELDLYFYMDYLKYIEKFIGNNIEKYPQIYLEWYKHWDAGTGVIWRKSAIKNIEEINI